VLVQCFEQPGQIPAVSNVFQQCWQPGEHSQRSDFCGRQKQRGQRILRKSGTKRRVSTVGARSSRKNIRPNTGIGRTIPDYRSLCISTRSEMSSQYERTPTIRIRPQMTNGTTNDPVHLTANPVSAGATMPPTFPPKF